jgi:hypothetical protein
MKKLLKILGISALVILGAFGVLFLTLNKSLPEGKSGQEAEALADKVLEAVDYTAWDSTCFIQWVFPGGHEYTWDKERGLCEVKWGENRVLLNTTNLQGIAFTAGKELSGEPAQQLVDRAWFFFANDSYWLAAPFKIRDAGTERRLVNLEDGTKGLLVTYTSGGVTPGDSYLWKVDEEGLPISVQMWVKIIPFGGLEFTWENWQELPSGAMLADTHKSSLFTSQLTGIKSAQTLEGLGLKEDLFRRLLD